jgi:hypothetical protein
LWTSETGGYNIVNVRLTTPPTNNVAILLASDNLQEGYPSVSRLVFTPANWSQFQSFRVTGVEDGVRDGDKIYHIITTAVSVDPNYNNAPVSDVTLGNKDSGRVAGFVVTPTSGLVTSESGRTATFSVSLTLKPTANVVIPITSSDPTEGVAAPGGLTFTPTNWNVPQPVTVRGVDDNIVDGNQVYYVLLYPAESADWRYNGKKPPNVAVVNLDNDTAAMWDGTYIGSYSGHVSFGGNVSPLGGSVRFTVLNGRIAVQLPAAGTGTIAANNGASFGSVTAGGFQTTFSGMFYGSGAGRAAAGGWFVSASTPFGAVVANGNWTVQVA